MVKKLLLTLSRGCPLKGKTQGLLSHMLRARFLSLLLPNHRLRIVLFPDPDYISYPFLLSANR